MPCAPCPEAACETARLIFRDYAPNFPRTVEFCNRKRNSFSIHADGIENELVQAIADANPAFISSTGELMYKGYDLAHWTDSTAVETSRGGRPDSPSSDDKFTHRALPDTVLRVPHPATAEENSNFSPNRCRISLSQALGSHRG